jgi:hypothetical protein
VGCRQWCRIHILVDAVPVGLAVASLAYLGPIIPPCQNVTGFLAADAGVGVDLTVAVVVLLSGVSVAYRDDIMPSPLKHNIESEIYENRR